MDLYIVPLYVEQLRHCSRKLSGSSCVCKFASVEESAKTRDGRPNSSGQILDWWIRAVSDASPSAVTTALATRVNGTTAGPITPN